jgi:PAS domain S-box-containing protein
MLGRIRRSFILKAGLAAAGLAVGVIIGASAISFFVAKEQVETSLRNEMHNRALLIATHLSGSLSHIADSLEATAENSLMANALADSGGRDAYLRPYLNGFTTIESIPVRMILSDYRGRPLAWNQVLPEFREAKPQTQAAAETGEPQVEIAWDGDHTAVTFAMPVLYANTGLPEGALSYQFFLETLSATIFVDTERGSPFQVLLSRPKNKTLALAAQEPPPEALTAQVPVRTPDILKDWTMEVRVWEPKELLSEKVRRLAGSYIILGVVGLAVILGISLLGARVFLARLRELETCARAVMDTHSLDQHFPHHGEDEVANLGKAFNTMLEDLKLAQDELRSEANREIKRHSERLKRVLAETSEGYIRIEMTNRRIVEVNEAFCRMSGRNCQLWEDEPAPEYLAELLDRADAAIQRTSWGQEIEIKLWSVPGVSWTLIHCSLDIDEEGNRQFVAFLTDVSERKRAEAILEESRERLDLALKGADLGLWDWNIPTGDVYFDHRWAEMLEYSLEEIEPNVSVWENLIHPDDKSFVMERITAHLEGKVPFYEAEHRLKTKSGGWKWILDRGKVVERDKDGTALRATGTHLDITDHKKTEQALRDNEEKFRAMSEAACDALIVIDSRDRIKFWNRAAEEMFGYSSEKVLNKHLHRIIVSEKYREDARRGLETFAASGHGELVNAVKEFTALRRDGTEFPVERSVAAFSMGGEWYAVGSLRDITQRKIAEYELRSSNNELMQKQAALDADLQAAAEIQKSLLPQASPLAETLEFGWSFAPSQTIGGDIFNIQILDPDHLGAYILDVSGHGVPSALVSVSVSQVLQPFPGLLTSSPQNRDRKYRIIPPNAVLRWLDKKFPLERFDKFCTVFYLVINHRSGEFSYCNAGHPPPVLVRASGEAEILKVTGSLVGLGEIVPFTAENASLAPGDTLVLYTDGCTEHMNPGEEEYGLDRLCSTLAKNRDLPPEDMLRAVEEDIRQFGENADPEDDISLICIRRKQK